jgi:cephalosporin-C deacetylase
MSDYCKPNNEHCSMAFFSHGYAFDPSYGYTLDALLAVDTPPPPPGFAAFWQQRYRRALTRQPHPLIRHTGTHGGFEIYDLNYYSTDDFVIGGWVLIPQEGAVRRGVVVGHGYGGREGPDFTLPIDGAAFLFPCFRGLARSRRAPISDNPVYHVLHDIDKRERYILGGCVEDLWLAVSALLVLFPAARGRIGYMGISFGGGIGALAMPWDERIGRAHIAVPSFGNHPLRLRLPTTGSAAAVQNFAQRHGNVLDTLAYYDAAIAARYIDRPVHVAAARFDPVVAPPGQFAIYNALAGRKRLYVLEAGHFDYPAQHAQEQALTSELRTFFAGL